MSWRLAPEVRFGANAGASSKNTSIKRGLAYHRRVYASLRTYQKLSAPDMILVIEPWMRCVETGTLRQPDALLADPVTRTAIVIEAKLNWADGRDQKLIGEYLQITQEALGLECTWPLVITSNLRGLKQEPLLGLSMLERAREWSPGMPTPVMLHP